MHVLFLKTLFLWILWCFVTAGQHATVSSVQLFSGSDAPTVEPTQYPTNPTSLPSSQPTRLPTSQPSKQPIRQPTSQPSRRPSRQPSSRPTRQPSGQPSKQPYGAPSSQPTRVPTMQPTRQPSRRPSSQPTRQPSCQPSIQPSSQPSRQPSTQPSRQPYSHPTAQPSRQPSGQPSLEPSSQPSNRPSNGPTGMPTMQPIGMPSGQPSGMPSRQPTRVPTRQPTGQPSRRPTMQPSRQPSRQPTAQPSRTPSRQPTAQPSRRPTSQPSRQPTSQPSSRPTSQPSRQPTMQPTRQPSTQPSRQPSRQPTIQPSRQPIARPSSCPSSRPSGEPSCEPSSQPTGQPTGDPTSQPSEQPTERPTGRPTEAPSAQPSRQPSRQPSAQPSRIPTCQPTRQPTRRPTSQPTRQPQNRPSAQPSRVPSSQPSMQPSGQPTTQPSRQPSRQPSAAPSRQPSRQPSGQPSRQPTTQPTRQPTIIPTAQPSVQPTSQPSDLPTSMPSGQPTDFPSSQPTVLPTRQPSGQPTRIPTSQPSRQPYSRPTGQPSRRPSSQPTMQPSRRPSSQPSSQPTNQPSGQPSGRPSRQPTVQPSRQPTGRPSSQPTRRPTAQPSTQPTRQPSVIPTRQPSAQPTDIPSSQPSLQPLSLPTGQPSNCPSAQPVVAPSRQPSGQPSLQPVSPPTGQPTGKPSSQPSLQPVGLPTSQPSQQPFAKPSSRPSQQPSSRPSNQPSRQPTVQPTLQPFDKPSGAPTKQPSSHPSRQPSTQPVSCPSSQPSSHPSLQPSCQPTASPTERPSAQPSSRPSRQPTERPSGMPSSQPVADPSGQPTSQPSGQPSLQPVGKPSRQPTSQPSRRPSAQPTRQPSRAPSSQPTKQPSMQPSRQPSRQPTQQPTRQPSRQPTSQPSVQPSRQPSAQPSRQPSQQPVAPPSNMPSVQPSAQPTVIPSGQPSGQPTGDPTGQPSVQPSTQPSSQPTSDPSQQPTGTPTNMPTNWPSGQPSEQPSSQPTTIPSRQPSRQPTQQPSSQPSRRPSAQPTSQPSRQPTRQPFSRPSSQPTRQPSRRPTTQPSRQPTSQPSVQPSSHPSSQPTVQPTMQPSSQPASFPSAQPSVQPTSHPSQQPSGKPSMQPSGQPSGHPSVQPTSKPSTQPSAQPSSQPTLQPYSRPSSAPSHQPSVHPSSQPTRQPSSQPSKQPVSVPTSRPSSQPSMHPSEQPSSQPTSLPTQQPSSHPSHQPSGHPSTQPSQQPFSPPTSIPSSQPSSKPTKQPTSAPSTQPSHQPTSEPSNQPTAPPSTQPSSQPSSRPSAQPSVQPSEQPSNQPSSLPSVQPSSQPSVSPTCQPSRCPTRQPSGQPSRHPTRQPSSQPTRSPTTQPSSHPSTQPTRQPSSQPSGYPTPIPSQFTNQSQWLSRLDAELAEKSLSLDSSLMQLMYFDLYYRYRAIRGGCSAYTSFLKSGDMTKALAMQNIVAVNVTTVKQLYDYYEIHDKMSDTVMCTVPSAASAIVHRLAGGSSTSFNVTCDGRMWNINNCGLSTPSLCIDCVDPCRIHCSNARYVNYLTPCVSDSVVCTDSVTGNTNGIIDSINMLSVYVSEKIAAPPIPHIIADPGLNSVVLTLQLANIGGVYCAVYPFGTAPTSLDDVRGQNNVLFLNTSVITMTLTGLNPVTHYSVYCFSFSSSGAHMSFSQMVTQGHTNFTTDCCRKVQVQIFSSFVMEGSNYLNLIKVSLDTLPSAGLTVTLSLADLSSNAMLSPNTLTFTSSSTVKYALISLKTDALLTPGIIDVYADLSGPSVDEYSVTYVSGVSYFRIIALGSEPPAPRLISAVFSSAGDSVTLTFDSATNKGGITTSVFTCSSLLSFDRASLSNCMWSSATTLVVYPSVPPSSLSYTGLRQFSRLTDDPVLNVGSTITLVDNTVQALCTIADCSAWNYVNGATVNVVAPVNAQYPSLVISSPATIGYCDSLTLDITSSSQFGGRRWRNVTIVPYSSQVTASALAALQAYFENNYVISPPVAVPQSMLSPLSQYTFVLTACNFLGACSSVFKIVSVLSGPSPYVSILGNPARVAPRSSSLQLYGSASVISSCGSAPSKSGLQYSWSVKKNNVLVTSLSSQSANPASFLLAPNTLIAGAVYYVTLSVLDPVSGVASASSVKVTVSSGDVVAAVSGASSRVVNLGETLLLNGGSSYAIDDSATGPKTVFRYSWSCVQISPNISTDCGLFFVDSNTPILHSTAVLVNTTSIVTMTIIDAKNRTDSCSVTVDVISSALSGVGLIVSVPSAAFLSSTQSYVVNSMESFVVLSQLTFNDSESALQFPSLTANWSVDDATLSLQDISSTPVSVDPLAYLASGINSFSFNLVVNGNSLVGGVKYRFTVSLQQYVASVSVLVNAPPLPGSFSLSPSEGTEASTPFVWNALQWQDADIPVTYEFGFYCATGALVVIQARSESSYITSTLPSTTAEPLTEVSAVLQVFDRYDASSASSFAVSIHKNLTRSFASALSDLQSSLSQTTGDYLKLKSVIALSSAPLSIVNCSTAVDCDTRFHRAACASTAQTCGACLTGFIGVSGDSNSLCISAATAAAASSRRRLTSDSSVVEHCTTFADCSSPFAQCIHHNCTVPTKTCSSNCSEAGDCRFISSNTGEKMYHCPVDNPECESVCRCYPGSYGEACEYTLEELNAKIASRLLLIESFLNETLVEDPSVDILVSWINLLNSLCSNPSELSITAVSKVTGALKTVLYHSFSISLSSTQLLPVVQSINTVLRSLKSVILSNDLDISQSRPLLDEVQNLIEFLVKFVTSQLVTGQVQSLPEVSEVRLLTTTLPIYSTASSVNNVSYALPLTAMEQFNQVVPTVFHLPAFTVSQGDSISVSAYSLTGALTTAATSDVDGGIKQYISNPVYLQFSSDSSLKLNCTEDPSNCEVLMILQFNQPVFYPEPFENITETVCYDLDTFVTEYSCLTSNENRTIGCPGGRGVFYDRCPIINMTTVCTTALDSGSGGSNCTVHSYTDHNVTCSCRIDIGGVASYTSLSGTSLLESSSRRLFDVSRRLENADLGAVSSIGMGGVAGTASTNTTFDRYFESNGKKVEVEDSQLVLYGITIVGGLIVVFTLLFFVWDRRSELHNAIVKMKKRAKKQNKISPDSSAKSDSESLKSFGSAAQLNRFDQVLEFDDDKDDDDTTNDEPKSADPLAAAPVDILTSPVLESFLPSFFHKRPKSFLLKVVMEFATHHRWINLVTNDCSQYTRLYRIAVLASNVLCVLFLQSVIYYYTDPNDGTCDDYKNERACIEPRSKYIFGASNCKWNIITHSCYFREPRPPVQMIMLVTMLAAVISVPFARLFEHLLMKLSMPSAFSPPIFSSLTESTATRQEKLPKNYSKMSRDEMDEGDDVLMGLRQIKNKPTPLKVKTPATTTNHSANSSFYPTTPQQLKQMYSEDVLANHKVVVKPTFQNTANAFNVNHFRCYSYINVMSLEGEVDMLRHQIRSYSESLNYLGNDVNRKLLIHDWGMDAKYEFLSSTLIARHKENYEIEDRYDMLIAYEMKRSRVIAVQELEQFEYCLVGSEEPVVTKAERDRRLLYVFQRDLIGSNVGGLILDNKSDRDNFMKDSVGYEFYKYLYGGRRYYWFSKPVVTAFLVGVHGLMLAYISLYFLFQPQQRQKAWLMSLLAWLVLDGLFVATMEVLLLHVALPSLIYRSMMDIHQIMSDLVKTFAANKEIVKEALASQELHSKHIEMADRTYLSPAKKRQLNIMQSHEEAYAVNSAEYFFASNRVSKYYSDASSKEEAAKFIRHYSSPLPPGHSFPSSWLRPLNLRLLNPHAKHIQERLHVDDLPSDIPLEPTESWYNYMKGFCAYSSEIVRTRIFYVEMWNKAMLTYLQWSYLLQDIVLRAVLTAAVASFAILTVFLYRIALFVLFIPTAGILVFVGSLLFSRWFFKSNLFFQMGEVYQSIFSDREPQIHLRQSELRFRVPDVEEHKASDDEVKLFGHIESEEEKDNSMPVETPASRQMRGNDAETSVSANWRFKVIESVQEDEDADFIIKGKRNVVKPTEEEEADIESGHNSKVGSPTPRIEDLVVRDVDSPKEVEEGEGVSDGIAAIQINTRELIEEVNNKPAVVVQSSHRSTPEKETQTPPPRTPPVDVPFQRPPLGSQKSVFTFTLSEKSKQTAGQVTNNDLVLNVGSPVDGAMMKSNDPDVKAAGESTVEKQTSKSSDAASVRRSGSSSDASPMAQSESVKASGYIVNKNKQTPFGNAVATPASASFAAPETSEANSSSVLSPPPSAAVHRNNPGGSASRSGAGGEVKDSELTVRNTIVEEDLMMEEI